MGVATGLYERRAQSRRKPGDPRSDVQVDRDRILHSHAFRRLQRKTQIVGTDTLDFVRTRLTHSLECAHIGRAICSRLTTDAWQGVVEDPADLADLVEAACLAHDLGHPPFGHTGEEALDGVLREHCGLRFEANAQSFRIVSLLEPKKYNRVTSPVQRPLGLDLTRATLKAMSKYPWTEEDARTDQQHGKFGVYAAHDDLEYFAWLWDGEPELAAWTLATELLEAADDVAYAVHDIEDGIWSGLIPVWAIAAGAEWAVDLIATTATQRSPGLFTSRDDVAAEIEAVFGRLCNSRWAGRPFDHSRTSEGGLKSFCSALTDELIRAVTEGGELRWSTNKVLQRRIAMLKAVIWVWMIEPPDLVMPRYAQRRIVYELFVGFLDEPGMLPYQDEWRRVADRSDRERARFVCDHVASMTDQYAMRLHSEMFNGRR